MQDTIYYLIIVIYYFWYFYVKNVIFGLGNLFHCFRCFYYFLGQIWFLLWLDINQKLFYIIFSCLSSFTEPLNRPISLYTFFNNYLINKIQTFVFLFSGGFQTLSPCGFKVPSWIRGYFQKQTCFAFCFLEIDVFCFLTLPHPASVGIRNLTYPGLVANV